MEHEIQSVEWSDGTIQLYDTDEPNAWISGKPQAATP